MEQIGVQLSIVIERKQAEAALLDSEQNYRTLVDMTPEIIYRLDENGRISFISSAIEQLGYQRQELIGKPFAELVHPDDREKVTNRFVERRVGGRSMKDVEVRLLEKCGDNSGRDYVLRWRSVALCSRGRWNVPDEEIQRSDKVFQCTQGVAHDISESKRAEKELERSKEAAEAASRAKSDFLANMSHELRTPLNAIIGFSEILQDLTFGPLNPKQSRYVDNVLTSGRHLLNLINDILDLSKVEAGKMKLEAAPLRVKAALEDALVLVKEKALKHSLDLILDAPDDLTITADERKFKQIMFNLLSNAAKFTPDGGRITVAAERCAGNVQISVTDTGIGIKPEDQSSLFREFQQIDSSLARKHEGTGLGLALSRKFAELHGGRIWVESPGAGKGSTFRFVMPLEQPGMRAKTLERIEWTADEFGVGVSLFNRQHQRLCGMINMLIDAQDTKSNQDLASRILSFMIEYAGEHFHDEEQLMSQYAYPDLDEHVRQHRAFVVKTTELLTAAKQGDEALPDKVLEFLRYWLTHHILGVDMKYKAFFGAKGVS
jgi:hemerythrin-like metal-binding protein/PAS domain S-box-containing protein